MSLGCCQFKSHVFEKLDLARMPMDVFQNEDTVWKETQVISNREKLGSPESLAAGCASCTGDICWYLGSTC